MLPDLFRDGKDLIGKTGHDPVGNVVFALPENPHISAAPDKLGVGHGLGDKSRPEIGALKKRLNDLDSLLLEESSQFQRSPQCRKIIGALQGQQVNGAWRRLEDGTLRMN